MSKENNENTIIPLTLIMVKSQWWLLALTTQINRVEQNMNSLEYEKQVQRMADDHFLKIALTKFTKFN